MSDTRTGQPPSPSPLLDEACDKAVACHQAGQWEAAEQLYRAILQAQPKHPAANHFFGLLNVQLQQAELGLPYLLTALESAPEQADYWLAYIDALLVTEHTDEAQQILALGQQHGLEGKAVEDLAARLRHPIPSEQRLDTSSSPSNPTQSTKPAPRKGARPSHEEENALVELFNQERYREGVVLAHAMTENFPQHGFGWKVLGALLRSQGNSADALDSFQKSARLDPQDAQAQSNLGLILGDLKRLPEAEACHRRAIAINPLYADAHNNLATALKLQERFPEAEASYRKALALKPDYAEALNNLGVTLYEQNRFAEAEAAYRAALAIQPDYADAYNNLGNALRKQGLPADAEIYLRHALVYRPDFANAHYNLASALMEQGRMDDAVVSFRQALVFNPNLVEAHVNLGVTFNEQGLSIKAKNCYRAALAINAESTEAYSNLGNAEAALGETERAVSCYKRAIEINPKLTEVHTSLLFTLSHSTTVDAAALFAEHCRFGEQFEAPLRASWPQHPNTRDPDRCLQVGFVSGDLRNHAVANFIEPVWAQLAHFPDLALHAYYTHTVEDATTQRLRTYLKHWNSIAALSEADLAQKILDDGIDILIDLSGHTGKNRLLTFARKPAPVQASWIGYPGTTGLRAMDYYFADRYYLPPGQFDEQFTEKLAYLPASAPFVPSEFSPPVNDLPALRAGYLTFGSFNRPGKLSESTIALWSQLLRALPDARMLLGGMSSEGEYDKLIGHFAQEGITRDRLSFYPRTGMNAYLALYHHVDICLDTYPYAGGTTTLHALWMGVPTLTVAGLTPAGRTGASILTHAGLDAFVAQDATDFVHKGVSWFQDLAALADLRAGLRARCNQSATRQPETIAANFERALRIMWQRWCKGLPAESFSVSSQD